MLGEEEEEGTLLGEEEEEEEGTLLGGEEGTLLGEEDLDGRNEGGT